MSPEKTNAWFNSSTYPALNMQDFRVANASWIQLASIQYIQLDKFFNWNEVKP